MKVMFPKTDRQAGELELFSAAASVAEIDDGAAEQRHHVGLCRDQPAARTATTADDREDFGVRISAHPAAPRLGPVRWFGGGT